MGNSFERVNSRTANNMDDKQIAWPKEFDPGCCPIHVRNEIMIAASRHVIWQWLIRARLWPTWYSNSAEVQILSSPSLDLFADARFSWRTFGVRLISQVREFLPCERIAWDAVGLGVRAYHAWLLAETSHGVRVRTEETQFGWLARLNNFFLRNRMSYHHDRWLRNLRDNAERGIPPDHV